MVYIGSASFNIINIVFFLLVILVGYTFAQNTSRPFNFLYHFGDGVFDCGNAISNKPFGNKLPAASLPYGETYPSIPTGRWSDGMLDIDYGAQGLGFPEIKAYLSGITSSNNAIIFAVARSPVLGRSFFTARGIRIPPYAASISIQISWFKKYLNTICSTTEDCVDKVVSSLFQFGDVEANDLAYALTQGKSIQEAETYIPYITAAQIKAAREVINLGAKRVTLPGNGPIGCYPYILTALRSDNRANYDHIGCLKKVNELIVAKNKSLQLAIVNLRLEFPNVLINYTDFYNTMQSLIRESALNGSNGNLTLKACCGFGGKYNYNSTRFCGSTGVTSCRDPSQYIFWDGIHLTQEANRRLSMALASAAPPMFGCTVLYRGLLLFLLLDVKQMVGLFLSFS